MDNLNLLVDCYLKNCKNEVKIIKKERNIWVVNGDKLYNDYKNNIISKKEFIKKTDDLDKKYYNSLSYKKIAQCKLDNCYNLTKKNLDFLLKKMKYPIKNKYNINDYIKILLLNQKFIKKNNIT